MDIDKIDMDSLIDICEGNESVAARLKQLIVRNSADKFADAELRRKKILTDFADFMNSFWDEGCTNAKGDPIDAEAHWEQNYNWGEDLLDAITHWES